MKEIIKHLNNTIKTYDSRRAKNNLIMVMPFSEQIAVVKNQPINKYLDPNWNRDRTGDIIKCYLYGETIAFDDVLQSLQELIDQYRKLNHNKQ